MRKEVSWVRKGSGDDALPIFADEEDGRTLVEWGIRLAGSHDFGAAAKRVSGRPVAADRDLMKGNSPSNLIIASRLITIMDQMMRFLLSVLREILSIATDASASSAI